MSLRRGVSSCLCGLLAAAAALVPLAPTWGQADDEPETQILSRGEGTIIVGPQRALLPWAESSFGPLVALAPVVAVLGGELEIGPLGEAHTLRVAGRDVVLGPLGRVVLVNGELHTLSIKPWLAPEPRRLYVPIDALTRAYSTEQGYRFEFDRMRRRLEVSRTGERRLAVAVDHVHDLGATTLVVTFSGRPSYRVDEYRGGVRLRLLSGVMAPRPRVRLNDPLVRWLEVRERSIDIGLAPRAKASEPYLLGRSSRVQLVMDITRDRMGRRPRPWSRHDEEREELRIVLDPGHGGADTGVWSPSGIAEKDLVLVIAQELKSHLEKSLGARVVLTRTDDSYVTLENRTAAANRRRADVFLSLHVSTDFAGALENGFQAWVLDPPPPLFASAEEHEPGLRGNSRGNQQDANRSVRSWAGARTAPEGTPAEDGEWGEPIGEGDPGPDEFERDRFDDPLDEMEDDGLEIPVAVPALELWERVQDGQLERSGWLARLIQSHVSDALAQPNRRVARAPLRVLTGASMPAVLIELGGLGGDEEEETPLLDEAYRQIVVEAIGRAIGLYRRVAASASGAMPGGAGS